jgi:hypothetical protein
MEQLQNHAKLVIYHVINALEANINVLHVVLVIASKELNASLFKIVQLINTLIIQLDNVGNVIMFVRHVQLNLIVHLVTVIKFLQMVSVQLSIAQQIV